ncbi:MAG: ester cyclase [Chloroflexi bacterium]|nr:MAG: ester cyclase [Chloroflexota bacterium]
MGDEQRNTDIVRKVEQLWIDNKLEQLDQYFQDERSHDRPPGVPQGIAGAKMAHTGAMQSFKDRKLVMKDIFAGGDRVFVRSTFSAQYMGGVPGIPAPSNGTPIKDIESWSVYRLKDGKIVEHWGLNDGFMIAMQAGALEMPQMAGAPPSR